METRKYEVTVNEKKGTCDNELFEKMAKKGDLTAIKLSVLVGVEAKITGYAKCHIVTDQKEFDINYFDTEEYGLVSSGSEIFTESVVDYFGEVESVRLVEVKTKKGKTYKAVPVLGNNKKEEKTEQKEETTKNEEITDDLPF
jgi:hypothetical protein